MSFRAAAFLVALASLVAPARADAVYDAHVSAHRLSGPVVSEMLLRMDYEP